MPGPVFSITMQSCSENGKHLSPGTVIKEFVLEIVHVEYINAKEAVYVELPNDLSDSCRTALKSIGISRLYSHQAKAIQASISGKNVVVATSTSSGKSLCYNVPVLEALSKNLSSCALYIFPTKALAQDQLRALRDMTKSLDINLSIGVYDGDTSQEDRVWVRDNARLFDYESRYVAHINLTISYKIPEDFIKSQTLGLSHALYSLMWLCNPIVGFVCLSWRPVGSSNYIC